MKAINICTTYREREKADGSHQLVLRVIIQRDVKYFPVGFDVLPKHFDKEKQLVKKGDPRNHEKNLAINNAISKAVNIQNYFLSKKLDPTIEAFTRRYQGTGSNQDCFYEYVENHLKRNNKKFAQGTKDFYRKHLSKLRGFSPSLSFADIDLDFLHSYKDYCYELRNCDATMFKSLEFIRRVLNAALKEDVIEKSPFRNFEIKNFKGNTAFLSMDQVKQLQELYDKNSLLPGQQNVLRFFLFACFTGLRYSDIYNLRFNNIITEQGNLFLRFTQQKTNKQTLVPIIAQAAKLIPEKTFDNAKVFRVVPNQTTNNHLKRIAEGLEWDLRLTFHVARNTCSNILYRLGVPVELRSMIVGDTAQVLRDHYTNTDQQMVVDAMAKLQGELV